MGRHSNVMLAAISQLTHEVETNGWPWILLFLFFLDKHKSEDVNGVWLLVKSWTTWTNLDMLAAEFVECKKNPGPSRLVQVQFQYLSDHGSLHCSFKVPSLPNPVSVPLHLPLLYHLFFLDWVSTFTPVVPLPAISTTWGKPPITIRENESTEESICFFHEISHKMPNKLV